MSPLLIKAYSWVGQKIGLGAQDAGFWRYWGGGDNYSGKSVNQATALQLSTVWACVRLLAETIATLPLNLYAIDRQKKASIAYGDQLYTILHDSPNGDMTAVDFWESIMAAILLWGNAYCRKDRLGTGDLVGLTPLRPELMLPFRDRDSGDMVYRYSAPAGRIDYDTSDIFHVKGFSLDGLVGLSPIAFARNSMGAAMAIEEASAVTFARGMRPAGVLSTEQILKKDTRDAIETKLTEKFAGAMNAGKVFVAEAGLQYKQVTMNPEDSQMLESRSFSVEELCRWYRVPPFMVGYTEKTTSWGTGLEQQNIGFLTYSLRPYLKRIEQAIWKSLISPNMRPTRFAEYNLEGLLRADSKGRAALYASAAQNGWMTRNEIRDKENVPRCDDANANKLTVQSNLLPLDDLGKNPPAQTPPASENSGHEDT